jgi:hypothetical protein
MGKFEMKNISKCDGIATLEWQLTTENDSIFLDYRIIGPFKCKGEKRRQNWSWSINYPKDRLQEEAVNSMDLLAFQMWGK